MGQPQFRNLVRVRDQRAQFHNEGSKGQLDGLEQEGPSSKSPSDSTKQIQHIQVPSSNKPDRNQPRNPFARSFL